MSRFELKFFTLALKEAEAFKMWKHEVDCLFDLCLNVWKKLISTAHLATSFRLFKNPADPISDQTMLFSVTIFQT